VTGFLARAGRPASERANSAAGTAHFTQAS
jgi:hypothetical protein